MMRHQFPLLQRFAADDRGVFAVIFGLMAIVLIALGGAVVDYVSLEQAKTRAQTAIDAAALALQSEINDSGVSNDDIRRRAQAIVIERIGDPRISAVVDTITVTPEAGRLFLGGHFTMPTTFVSLVGVNQLNAQFSSEVVRGSMNLEVALALDVTGSMAGTRMTDLKKSANELVAEILKSNSDEVSARVALVPYSQAVNVGSYAATLRGPEVAGKTIASIAWSTGTSKNVTGMEMRTPMRIKSPGHGFQNNDWVYVTGLSGFNISNLNNQAFQVVNRTNDTFDLSGTTPGFWASYYSGGTVTKCARASCTLLITSNGHGFQNNDYVVINGATGMTGINGKAMLVSDKTTNTLVLSGVPAGGGGTYTANSGKMYCTKYLATEACRYYVYPNQAGGLGVASLTTCVTERPGPNAFNDQPPSATLVGRNYPPANDCPNTTIVPLTKSENDLKTVINALPTTGTTAGSLGILWSWYMLSPHFGYIWPAAGRPEPYGTEELLKAAIIMTDGEFNTVHYNGVLSRDSGIGSTSTRHVNNAHNGLPFVQAKAYCDSMHRAGITVYTVGFGVAADSDEADTLSYCASDADKFYLASNGAALSAAFKQIARNISTLRVSQ